jgi:hypothetical protein
MTQLKRGQIVRYRAGCGHHLRSGSSAYASAVVVSTDPLVLVSEHTDMRWQTTVAPSKLEVIGRVWPWRLWFHFDKRKED